jgi:hypothetical protein
MQIQYTSDTDAQWKFPLVRELSTAIILAVSELGSEFDVDYRVHKFRHFETLVIYRRAEVHVPDNLLPRLESQALHPMPFPDTSRLQLDYVEQIYNAAWNGILLGYPERFVRSYCSDFHNDLPKATKLSTFMKAKADLTKLLANINQTAKVIALGNTPVVKQEFWDYISNHLSF